MTGALPLLAQAEPVPGLPAGVSGWTTTRANGSFGLGSTEPVEAVVGRWSALQADLRTLGVERLASAHQIHGADVTVHADGWRGWLRGHGVDGHVTTVPGTALAVTVADCTPVLLAHPAGAVAALHAGWRGTAAQILRVGVGLFAQLGFPAHECVVHLGPSICGPCYEVGPEVLEAVTGRPAQGKGYLDVRAVLAEQAQRLGVPEITISAWCTRCHNDRFYSHRAGDPGRQLGVIALASS
ncbi:MAG: polyphenol oxidase family protein [Gemmatimonadaceae bacterium]|nr:polyphenol oxidase family protein [Gemmatimonadaceae bacterium]